MAEEKQLDNKVIAFIKSQGGWCLKYWAGNKWTKIGIPDILACVDGIFYGIEDKASNGKPKLLQLKNLEWIRQAGGYGILLYPDDFENFKKFVKSPNNMYDWYVGNIALQAEWQEKLQK